MRDALEVTSKITSKFFQLLIDDVQFRFEFVYHYALRYQSVISAKAGICYIVPRLCGDDTRL